MKKHIARIALFSLVAAGLVAVPIASRADDASKSDKTATATPPPAKKKAHTFHGSVMAVDTAVMSLTVGTNTIYVTSETMITKGDKPATLSEITVGDNATGTCKVDDAGKMNATAIHAGAEKGSKKPKKKTSAASPAAPASPAPTK